MELTLSPTEIEELRKLQRNLQGRSDYARVTCILMLSMGNTPIFVADCLGIDTDAKQVSQWVKDTFEVTYTPQGMADLFANHFFLTINGVLATLPHKIFKNL